MKPWKEKNEIPPLQDEINNSFAGRVLTGIICSLFAVGIDTGIYLWGDVPGAIQLSLVIIGLSFIGGFIGGQRFLDYLRKIINKFI
jgi:hypothetical protein